MKTIETTVYEFDELNDKAKENARAWFRNDNNFDSETVKEDAKEIAALMGITIDRVLYSGFWSQGDGACFGGRFEGKEGGKDEVYANCPLDTELNAIAEAWEELQKKHSYKLEGRVRHQGNYQHDQCTRITANIPREIDNLEDDDYYFDTDDSMVRDNPEPGAKATNILRRLMRWIYSQLEKDYEYQNSDAVVDENIKANDYTFTESGKRFG